MHIFFKVAKIIGFTTFGRDKQELNIFLCKYFGALIISPYLLQAFLLHQTAARYKCTNDMVYRLGDVKVILKMSTVAKIIESILHSTYTQYVGCRYRPI